MPPMPMILPASPPPVRPEPAARISFARAGSAGGNSEFGKTLARATRTDKNDAADRSGRKATSKAEPKEAAKPFDRDAVDESLSSTVDGSSVRDGEVGDATDDDLLMGESPASTAPTGNATDVNAEAQDSPSVAQDSAQEAASSESAAAETNAKSDSQSTVAGGSLRDQIGATTAGSTDSTTGGMVGPQSAELPVTQPDADRTQAKRLLSQFNTANEESSRRAPTNPNAVAATQPADAAAASAAIAASAQRDESKSSKQESAPTPIAASSARAQPLQAQTVATQARPQSQYSNKAKSGIEVNAVVTDSQPASAAAPASARAAQVEASIRMENALAMMANSSEGNATSRMSTDHAVQAIAGSKLADATTSSPSLAQQLQTWSSPEDQEFSGQMTRGLAAMMNQRGGMMTMRLNPPELGEVRVQMTLSRGVVSAEFQASTAQAHALLDRNLTALRSALEGQGLTVDRLNVHVAPPAAAGQQMWRDESSGSWNQHGGSSQNRHDHDAANGESRGRHEQSQDGRQRWNREADFSDFFNDLETQFATVSQS